MEIIDPQANQTRDPHLLELARRRVGFKTHAMTYIIVNAFLVGIWFVSDRDAYFWPIWPMMGWGIGVVFNYLAVYHSDTIFSVEKEYNKLKNKSTH